MNPVRHEEGLDVSTSSICRTRPRGCVRGRAGSPGDCQCAGCVRAPAQRGADRSGGRADTPLRPSPPLGRAKPSGLKPYLGPAGHGVTLDAAEEPAAVRDAGHDAAGEQRDGAGSRRAGQQQPAARTRGTSSRRIRRAATSTGRGARSRRCRPGTRPLYFASAILPDGRMIVEGGEYIGEKRGVVEQGRDLQPGDQHLGFGRTATGLDEHRGRRERRPGQRHLHAPAAVPDLPHRIRS